MTELKIEWFFSNQCNFNCTYCPSHFHDGSQPYPEFELLKKAYLNLRDQAQRFNGVKIQINGGEPSHSNSLRQLLLECNDPKIKYKLVSNGSASLDWWRSIKHKISEIDLTYHPHYLDLDHFKKVVEIISTEHNMIWIRVPFMPETQNWDKSFWAYKELKKYNASMLMLYSNLSRGSNQYLNYTKDQWEYYFKENNISKSNVNTTPQKMHNYYGNLCWSGVEQAVITYDGDVFRGWCMSGAPMGNVYKGTFVINSGPLPCPKERCGNGFDQQSRKSEKSWGMT